MRRILLLLALVFAPCVGAERLSSLGTPPPGYAWFGSKESGVAVLKPDGWFTKAESQQGTDALFVAKEDLNSRGRFETGLSLNALRGVKQKTGLSASQYAYAFLAKSLEGNEELMSFGGPADGTMTIGLRFRNRGLDKVIHYYLVASDSRDTLHIFMFEAPSKEWDAAWRVGEPIFRNLRIVYPGDEGA